MESLMLSAQKEQKNLCSPEKNNRKENFAKIYKELNVN